MTNIGHLYHKNTLLYSSLLAHNIVLFGTLVGLNFAFWQYKQRNNSFNMIMLTGLYIIKIDLAKKKIANFRLHYEKRKKIKRKI